MSETQATVADLSCQECRKRKVKCNRALPACSGCIRASTQCAYPTEAQKPGPKPGHRRSAKRVRLDNEPAFNNVSPEIVFTRSPTGLLAELDQCRNETPSNNHVEHRRDYLNLASLIHPSHGTETGPPSPAHHGQVVVSTGPDAFSPHSRATIFNEQVCQALHTTANDCDKLVELFFSNMTAFSLFDSAKLFSNLRSAQTPNQRHALLAAMFAFSSRFRKGDANSAPTSEDFYRLAVKYIEDAFESCGESHPPMIIVQAMVLTTFHELIHGARGKGWRSIGALVRLAYELELHLIDSDKFCSEDTLGDQSAALWSAKEEKRRIWWTIWEMDVFASTVRRLPTAIDWSHNLTLLPVSDESWFKGVVEKSCFLLTDTTERCKALHLSGNHCAKAWFLVVNSLMRDAHLLSDPHGLSRTHRVFGQVRDASRIHKPHTSNDATAGLTILKNDLYYFNMSLPIGLRYRGENLSFEDNLMHRRSRQKDSDVYSIQAMIQLTRIILNIGNAVENVVVERSAPSSAQFTPPESVGKAHPARAAETDFWKHYLHPAENIQTLICNSSPDHVQMVNPFLATTIWLAAAILIAYRILGTHDNDHDKELLDSNFNLLRTNFTQFVHFWNISTAFLNKLSQLQVELERLVRARENRGNARSGAVTQKGGEPIKALGAQAVSQSHAETTPPQDLPLGDTSTQQAIDVNALPGLAFGPFNGTLDGLTLDAGTASSLYSGFGYDWELQSFLDDMFATQLMPS